MKQIMIKFVNFILSILDLKLTTEAKTVVFTSKNRYTAKYMLIYINCLSVNFVNKK